MRLLLASLLFTVCVNVDAFAWGSEAHRIVAEIAEQYLEPEAGQKIHELLALDNVTDLEDVANWADDIRRQRPETAPWHYVDIPIHSTPGVPEYLPARDCPIRACVIAKIEDFVAKLRVIRQPTREKLGNYHLD